MPVAMAPLTLVLIFATFFSPLSLKGTAGLGFATTCLGVMAAYLDMRVAIPLVIIPSLLSNVLVMVDAAASCPPCARFKFMFLAALPGWPWGCGCWEAVPRPCPDWSWERP